MKQSKYYIRVMRPIFQRAIFTVEATSGEEALRSAQERVEQVIFLLKQNLAGPLSLSVDAPAVKGPAPTPAPVRRRIKKTAVAR